MTRVVVLGGLLLAVGLAALRRTLLVVSVDGHSMEPTIGAGSRVLARRVRPGAVRRGSVVVLAPPVASADPTLRRLVKRVAAVPGDALPAGVDAPAGRVPPGRLVVLGDNPDRSLDSRHLGLFRTADVQGVVVRSIAGPRPARPREAGYTAS